MLTLLLIVVFFCALAGAGIFLTVSRRQANTMHAVPEPGGRGHLSRQPKSKFHAVSVCMDPSPCHAVRELADQRFLSSEAPVLPLADCDQPECNCHFEHYPDRRAQQNRRDTLVALGRLSAVPADETGAERRSWGDRRRTPGRV